MTGQQICLKWNSYQANILSSFETLWEEEGLVDVTLASDGECIRAHRVILSACSPFFKRLFLTNPCQHPVIILQDVHYSELEAILNFVYKGEVNIDQENLPALLRAAETLQIRGLSGTSEQVKEKIGVPKTSTSVPSRQSSRDGSPPYKRRRSEHLPRSPSNSIHPTSVPENTRHPPSTSLDSSEPLHQHRSERRNSECNSPPSLEETFEESVDEFLDVKAVHVPVPDTEQLKEITVALENETSCFKVGAAYSTFKEFEDAFNAWADEGHHPMRRDKSKRNRNTQQQKDHPYEEIDYACKHHGQPIYRGKNIRPNQHHLSKGCPVVLRVAINYTQMKYIVRKLVTNHNHRVSAELRSQYSDRRMLLKSREEQALSELVLDGNAKPKQITSFLKNNFGKSLFAKDIHNFKKKRLTKKDRLTAAFCAEDESDTQHNVPQPYSFTWDAEQGCIVEVDCPTSESVYHVTDTESHFQAPVKNVYKRKAASLTPRMQDIGLDVPVNISSNETSSFKVGAAYSTFKEFEDAFNAWADEGHHPMSRAKSRRNRNTQQQTDHPYEEIDYACKHHGKPICRGKNIRPNQNYLSQGCPVILRVKINYPQMKYIVRKLVTNHNHKVSAELRSQYPDRRMLLDGREEQALSELVLDGEVKPMQIMSFLKNNFGKTLCSKDIHNFKKNRLTKKECLTAAFSPEEEIDTQHNVPEPYTFAWGAEQVCITEVHNEQASITEVPDEQASITEVPDEQVCITEVQDEQVCVKKVECPTSESVCYVTDTENQLEARVENEDTRERKATSSTSHVHDMGGDVPVEISPKQVKLPVIHVKKIAAPGSSAGKMVMVRTKPTKVILIQPPTIVKKS